MILAEVVRSGFVESVHHGSVVVLDAAGQVLAAGTPVIATDIGGMAVQLRGYAQLTPRRDVEAMAKAISWVAQHPAEARDQALKGSEYVSANWRREKAFGDLKDIHQSCDVLSHHSHSRRSRRTLAFAKTSQVGSDYSMRFP